MSRRNLSVSKKTHKHLLNKLKDKKILKIYNKFENNLKINKSFIVAVSGGPDSLALSFLTKIYSIKKSINVEYFIVNHNLRKNSLKEAKLVKALLKKISVKLNILHWIGKKPKSNIQSIARSKRYSLLINTAKKLKTKIILLGHHKGDLYENFFIRILRGSGLKGLVSFDKHSQIQEFELIRPLLKFDKKDLIYISKNIFDTYVEDPSNEQEKFKRIKMRNLIKSLQAEGLNFDKFDLTIKNLKLANYSIEYFTEKNIKDNSYFFSKNKSAILNDDFFNCPKEVVFRSFTSVIRKIGEKYYSPRGKKIDNLLHLMKLNRSFKLTLGSCIIRKVNRSVIVTKEH